VAFYLESSKVNNEDFPQDFFWQVYAVFGFESNHIIRGE